MRDELNSSLVTYLVHDSKELQVFLKILHF